MDTLYKLIRALTGYVILGILISSCEKDIKIQDNQPTSFVSKFTLLPNSDLNFKTVDIVLDVYYSYENYLDSIPDETIKSEEGKAELDITTAEDYFWVRAYCNYKHLTKTCINQVHKYTVPKSFNNTAVTYEIEIDSPVSLLRSIYFEPCAVDYSGLVRLKLRDDNKSVFFDTVFSKSDICRYFNGRVDYVFMDMEESVHMELWAVGDSLQILNEQIYLFNTDFNYPLETYENPYRKIYYINPFGGASFEWDIYRVEFFLNNFVNEK